MGNDDSSSPEPTTVVAQQDYLLKNTGSSFVDVSAAVGIASSASLTMTAEWADADKDGDQDLMVGKYSTVGLPDLPKYYVNNNDGTMSDLFPQRGNVAPRGVCDLGWSDYDGDGDLDVAMVSTTGESLVMINEPLGYYNSEPALSVALGYSGYGAARMDHNMDGKIDLLVHSDGSSPIVYQSRDHYAGLRMSDETEAVGLAGHGAITGMSISDWDSDGDPDFYAGGLLSDQKYQYVTDVNPDGTGKSGSAEGNWLKINMVTSGANNSLSLGVLVEISYGAGYSQAQFISGGSGRGGSSSGTLTFGLGDYASGDVSVKVYPIAA